MADGPRDAVRKHATALIELLDSASPPDRFVAGADAVQGVSQKAELLRQDAAAFPELSASLHHENKG